MVATRIGDVIVPEVFNGYVIERTAELSALQASGVIQNNPAFDALASSGGKLLNMPFWEDLDGDDEVLSDSSPLSVNNIEADKDVAVLIMRGKAWGVNDLAQALSGDDPMGAIADLVAAYWARRRQATLLAILEGVFADSTMTDNVLDITAESGTDGMFTGETFIDAMHKLGDAESRLTAVGVHSNTYASMRKQNLIEFIPVSEGQVQIPTYMGRRVIVDDGMPVDTSGATDVYTSYLFGEGAFALGNGGAPVPTETDRDSLQGDDILINRQHFILHPRGVAFQNSSVSGASPSNAELADDANWARVYEAKNVRLVAFKHKNVDADGLGDGDGS